MKHEEIEQNLKQYSAFMKDVSGKDFECGVFIMSQDAQDPKSSKEDTKVTAMVLGHPRDVTQVLTTTLLDLAKREPMFVPVVTATALGLIHAIVMDNEDATKFFIAQIEEMKAERAKNEANAETVVSEELSRIFNTLH